MGFLVSVVDVCIRRLRRCALPSIAGFQHLQPLRHPPVAPSVIRPSSCFSATLSRPDPRSLVGGYGSAPPLVDNFPLPRTLVPAHPDCSQGQGPNKARLGKKSSVFFLCLSHTTTHPATLLQHPLPIPIPITVPTALPLRVFWKVGCESYCCFCWRLKVQLISGTFQLSYHIP